MLAPYRPIGATVATSKVSKRTNPTNPSEHELYRTDLNSSESGNYDGTLACQFSTADSGNQHANKTLNYSEADLFYTGMSSIQKGNYDVALMCLLGSADCGDKYAIKALNDMCKANMHENKENLIAAIKKTAHNGPLTAHSLMEVYFDGIDESWYDAVLKELLPRADHGNADALRTLDLFCQEMHDDKRLADSLNQFTETSTTACRIQRVMEKNLSFF